MPEGKEGEKGEEKAGEVWQISQIRKGEVNIT